MKLFNRKINFKLMFRLDSILVNLVILCGLMIYYGELTVTFKIGPHTGLLIALIALAEFVVSLILCSPEAEEEAPKSGCGGNCNCKK